MPIAKIRIQTQNLESSSYNDAEAKESDETKARKAFISLAVHQSINLGKQTFQNSVSMIGISTGDYQKQESIETILNVAGTTASLIGSYVINPYMGIANTIITASKETFKIVKTQKEIEIQNLKTETMAKRSGNSTTNGSRTGN